jgi:hypothetical protein
MPTGSQPAPAPAADPRHAGEAPMTRAYVTVLVLHIAVLLALWAFSRYFR